MSVMSLPDELLCKAFEYLSPADLYPLTLLPGVGAIAKQVYYHDIYVLNSKEEYRMVQELLNAAKQDEFNQTDEFSHLEAHNVFYNMENLDHFLRANSDLCPQNLILSDDKNVETYRELLHQFQSVSVLNTVGGDLCEELSYKHLIINGSQKIPANVQELTITDGDEFVLSQIPLHITKLSLVNTPITVDQLSQFAYLQELQLINSIHERLEVDLPRLKSLYINNFYKLGDLTNLSQLSRLELYNVNDNNLLLPSLLSYLTIGDGTKLSSLQSIINQVPNLMGLSISAYFVCNYGSFYRLNYPANLQELSIKFDQGCYFDIYNQINTIQLPKTLQKLSILNGEDLLLSSLELPETLKTFVVDNICGFSKNFVLPKSIENLKLTNIFDYNEDFFPPYLQNLVINNCFLTNAPFHYLVGLKSLVINDNSLSDLSLPNSLTHLNVTSEKLSGLTIPPNNYNYTNNYYSNSNMTKLILNTPALANLELPVENLNYFSLGNNKNSLTLTLPDTLSGLVLNNNDNLMYNLPTNLSYVEQH